MTPQLVAIIPAAGHSRRMGQPKLLLEVAGHSVIARVIGALQQAGVARCLVVVRADDSALATAARSAGAEVVIPAVDPDDMRQSVEWALRHLYGETLAVRSAKERSFAERTASVPEPLIPTPPAPCEGWVLVPADHPTLNPKILRELVAAWSLCPDRIAVPVFDGKRGHPTIFQRRMGEEVLALPLNQGLNQLLRSDPARVLEVEVTDPHILDDLDTPEEFLQLLRQWESPQ